MRTPPTVTAVIKAQSIDVGQITFKSDGSFSGSFADSKHHEEFLSAMSLGELVTIQARVHIAGNEEPCVLGTPPHFGALAEWCVAHRAPAFHTGLDEVSNVCSISARTMGCSCCGAKS